MYFTREETQHLIDQIKGLMCDRSRFWFDQVSRPAVSDTTGIAEIKAFMDHMRMVGEPFVSGFDGVKDIKTCGLDVAQYATASEVLNRDDPVFKHYSFALCRK